MPSLPTPSFLAASSTATTRSTGTVWSASTSTVFWPDLARCRASSRSRLSHFTARPSMTSTPRRVMVTWTVVEASAGTPVLALGSLTVSCDCTRIGVSTMKMMTRISASSMSGTRLGSAITRGRPISTFMRGRSRLVRLLGQRFQDLLGDPGHLFRKARGAVVEVVVGEDGGDGHEQAGGRADQGFRDADGHHAGTRAGGAGQVLEGAHDADHRAEQPDEGRGAGDGAKQGDAPLQQRDRAIGGALGRALALVAVGRADQAGHDDGAGQSLVVAAQRHG